MDEEKFLNTDEMMVDFSEMTSFNFQNNAFWNANMVEDENNIYIQQPYRAGADKFDLLDMLRNMAFKFGFHSVKA